MAHTNLGSKFCVENYRYKFTDDPLRGGIVVNYFFSPLQCRSTSFVLASAHLKRRLSQDITNDSPLMWNYTAIRLYRAILRQARSSVFPKPVARKVAYNARVLFDLYRNTSDKSQLQLLYGDAEAAVRVLKWFGGIPEVLI